MGVEFSQIVRSDLQNSTLKELLCEKKFVERLREAAPVLDDNVRKNLRELLTKKSAKRRLKRKIRPGSASKESPLSQDATGEASAQEDAPQEATAAGTNATASDDVSALSTTSDKVLPTTLALLTTSTSSGEGALSSAASVEDVRTRPLWEIKEEDVALPSEVVGSFETWKADPSTFFRSGSSQVPTSLIEHYDYALSVRSAVASNKILWRFITTAYYDIISERSPSDRYFTKEAVAFVVDVICRSPLYDRKAVEEKIIGWAKEGARHRALANKLGGLCCYFFYPNVSEWIWKKHLSQNAYDQAAELLIRFGIFEKAQQSGAVGLARSIETILKAPFQSTVQWIPSQQTTKNAGDIESCEGPQKRKSAAEALSQKRRRPETRTAQRPYLPSPQSHQDLINGEEQAADSHSWSDNFASTPPTTPSQGIGSTIPSQNIGSTPPIAESRQFLTLNYINYEATEQAARNVQDLDLYSTHRETYQADQESTSRVRLRCRNDDVQDFFFDRSRLLHSPPPPQALLVSECLFRTTKIYFESSCRNMTFDGHGTLLNRNGTRLNNDLCNDFDSYCFTATMLIGRNLRVEFRHALSKAAALVKQILQAQHPRTLACFLEVFIHLIQTGLPDVANIFRRFIGDMSAAVITDGQPWGQICRLLGELDSESLDEGMAQIWKCTADTFESELGTSSRLAVSVRLDYIKRVYGVTNMLEEELLLQDLLSRFGDIPSLSTPRVMLNLAHNLNRQGRHEEAENMARKVLSLLQEHEMYNERIVERIECLKIVAHSQFNRRNVAAEQTMREAIQMIVDQWGIQHSWFFEFMNVLQSWLKDWGREDDANKLQEEIVVLRRKDVIDEQFDGV